MHGVAAGYMAIAWLVRPAPSAHTHASSMHLSIMSVYDVDRTLDQLRSGGVGVGESPVIAGP